MLTATATTVGWRVDYDIVDSVRVEAVDGIEQTDLEWGARDIPQAVSIGLGYELACGWICFVPR